MRAIVGALFALTALGCVGCGADPSSHHGFVHEAALVCRQANRELSEIEISRPDARLAAAALERVVEIGSGALERLHDLKPPDKDAQNVQAWLGTLEQALDQLSYARELLTGGRIDLAIDAAQRADRLTGRARVLARRIGVDRVCHVPRLIPQQES